MLHPAGSYHYRWGYFRASGHCATVRFSWCTIAFGILTSCLFATHVLGQDASLALRMQGVVKKFVQDTGMQIIGLGSWISGKGYVTGVSDHDLRLLMPPGTSPEAAQKTWAAAQQQLRELIKREFGGEAPKVLSRTNLYPPTQLMRGVLNPEDAMERFIKYRRVPNLGYTGAVTSSTPARFAEGMYGVGAETYVQAYERQAGKLFYRHQGKVFTGMTDLTHLKEGLAQYTVRGTANTAGQWTVHLVEALQSGNAKTVLKYLERLERDLVKCRDLAQLGTDTALRRQLRTLIGQLRANPRALNAVSASVSQVARRAAMEAALLSRYDRAGTMQRAFVRLALDGLDVKNALGEAMEKVFARLPSVPVETVAHGVITYFSVVNSSRALGEGDALSAVAEAGLPFVSLGPGLLMQLTAAIIEGTKEAGYDFVAGRQDAFDLLEGIFTTFGREGLSDRRYSLDQLVENIETEEHLAAFVRARAVEAATRGEGEGRVHDAGVAEAIYNRCFPVILRAWRARREVLATEFFDLLDFLSQTGVVLVCQPDAVVDLGSSKEVKVTVTALPIDQSVGYAMERLRRILRVLLGSASGPYVNVHNTWTEGGVEGSQGNERVYTYTAPGRYQVRLDREISIGAAGVPKDCPFIRAVKQFAVVEIEVKGKPQQPPKPPGEPKPPSTPPAPPAPPGDYVLVNVEKGDKVQAPSRARDVAFGETSMSGMELYGDKWHRVSMSWQAPGGAYKAGDTISLSVSLDELWGEVTVDMVSMGRTLSTATVTADSGQKSGTVTMKVPGPGLNGFQIIITAMSQHAAFIAVRGYDYEARSK
ncbi:MAG: hypothetical protein N2512_13065 [Armatimonadetes bacterium]|nr:hypothetical protein [Armatimonadota bacterium]